MTGLPLVLNSILPVKREEVSDLIIIPPAKDNDIAVVFDVFLRDALILKLIKSIFTYQPGVKLYIADQGVYEPVKMQLYDRLEKAGHKIVFCGFDAGISTSRNKAIKEVSEDFIFVCDGDNEFNDKTDLKLMKKIISNNDIDFLGMMEVFKGEVRHYENLLEIKDKKVIYTDISSEVATYPGDFTYCDMTMNVGLGKKQLFDKIQYDNRMKLAEHLDWFLQIKYKSSFKVAVTTKTRILNQDFKFDNSVYNQFRGRNKIFWKLYIDKWNLNYVNDWKIENVIEESPKKEKLVIISAPAPVIAPAIVLPVSIPEPDNKVTSELIEMSELLNPNQYFLVRDTCFLYLYHLPLKSPVYISMRFSEDIAKKIVRAGWIKKIDTEFIRNEISFIFTDDLVKGYKTGNALRGKNFAVPSPFVEHLHRVYGVNFEKTIKERCKI